jgi:hypothetical protein
MRRFEANMYQMIAWRYLCARDVAAMVAAVLMLGGLSGQARAEDARAEIGVLTCSVVDLGDTPSQPQGDAAASQPQGDTADAGMRDLECAFRPSLNAPLETYVGSFQSVGDKQQSTLMWAVIGPVATPYTPGLLQQTYTADASAAPNKTAPLLGQGNSALTLRSMTETSSDGKPGQPPTSMIIIVTLKLKSSGA